MSSDKFRFAFSTLKFRLILILTVLLIPSFIGISVLNYHSASKIILESLTSTTMPLIRESFYKKLQLELRDPVLLSSLMANDTFLMDWIQKGEEDLQAVEDYLMTIRTKYGFSSTFFVSQTTRNYYTATGILKTVSPKDAHDQWYYQFIRSGEEYDLDVDTDQASKDLLTIFINYRVEKEGKLLGVTGVGIAMNEIAGYLRELREKYGALVYMIDSTGIIQAHPDMQIIENARLQDIPGLENATESILTRQDQPRDLEYSGDRGQVLMTVQYIRDLDWYIVVEENQTDVLREARRILAWNILLTVSISLLVIVVSMVIVHFFQSRLEYLARIDKLTGIANRRELETVLELEGKRAQRYGRPLSIAMADLDFFKRVNDTWGHPEGDRILRKFAEMMEKKIRSTDTVGRWGGEEFLLILPETGHKGAYLLVEQIRTLLMETDLSPVKDLTVSFGVGEWKPGETLEELFSRTDKALYAAKNAGRNRAVVAD